MRRKERSMYRASRLRLPKAVYYQCTWIVKDIDRLYRLDAMRRHVPKDDELVFSDDEDLASMSDEVMEEASRKLACIKEALKAIPEEYRMLTVECISDANMPAGIAHENTWKKWRRTFIKELACKLNLI